MLLVFASRTNNIQKIVEKLNVKNTLKIIDGNELIHEKFFLLTYTDYLGQVPEIVDKFLKKNHKYLLAVAGSGNKNFGSNFCKATEIISSEFNVPIIAKFDLSGNEDSIKKFYEKMISFSDC